ncbi:hypothetical protein OIDMADRAFT_59942 [Oidiodendron maius Zn]|uniref:Methyltransferase domain-containing protein n=1 Tax=Oidiodendron maius (strain Zn) TaxID=913774 RepID=A0A0C3D0P3_OIDMZ|nr:hypothetical protein OIDMADRAFT_59942 [Oidiodendron maius Zn]
MDSQLNRSIFSRVKADWWTDYFDEYYLRSQGKFYEDAIVTSKEWDVLSSYPEIQQLLRRGDENSQGQMQNERKVEILDLNCGQGRHSILIANSKSSIQVHGHDQSQFLIDLARARSSHLSNVRFSVGDSCSVPADRNSYNMVMILGNSFGFYPTEMGDHNMLAEVYRVLQPGGVLLLECTDATFIRENYELINEKWRWLGQDENLIACYQRELSHDGRRLATREIIVATDKGIIKDTSIPVRLYDQSEFTEIFRNVGFVVSEDSFRKWPTTLLSGQYGMLKNRVTIKVCKPV